MNIRHILLSICAAVICAFSQNAYADSVIQAVPTNWRLENYGWLHTVKLWYTGAPECTNGGLDGTAMSQDDFNRLWSMMLTAKSMNKAIGIFYSVDNGACNITSFYMDS